MRLHGPLYRLGGAVYLALTDQCNARTLVATRGPSFCMPLESGFQPLDGKEPSAECLADHVSEHLTLSSPTAPPVVSFAGLGEPLLRSETLLETISLVRDRHGDESVKFRVVTNALFPAELARALAKGGVHHASVALARYVTSKYLYRLS